MPTDDEILELIKLLDEADVPEEDRRIYPPLDEAEKEAIRRLE